jgi:hypothetical protein
LPTSRRAYGFFVITLLADAQHYKTMTITFNKQPTTHIKKYLKRLIEPLFILRGLEMLSLEHNDEHLGPGLGAAMTTKIKNGLQFAKFYMDTKHKETPALGQETSFWQHTTMSLG